VSFELPNQSIEDCTFCSIISGSTEANWESRPTDDARVVCFHNRLKWERVMLLIVPTQHLTQQELWSSDVLIDATGLAIETGDKHCGNEGYRAISNFGLEAHQSQPHAHIHIVSGTSKQLQSATRKSTLEGTENTSVAEYDVHESLFAASIAPNVAMSQRELWSSDQILETSRQALKSTESHSPNGFRLMSNFEPSSTSNPDQQHAAGENPASLFLLGGGQLGLYV
jgi:diadenosine tetraphosphate (Ap4A) HIT family hydrolase